MAAGDNRPNPSMIAEPLPRPFGPYALTAALGQDALGRVYRAIRPGDDSPFVRLRLLDGPELSSDLLCDTIQDNGEVHDLLRNAAIARGVDMDAVDGVPYIAWSEPNGRTLDAVIAKCRGLNRKIPVEHALLIVEKVATALDHAYNTTIDGDRTVHGLVWPGFITISDDAEVRLGGFGLAPAVLPALGASGLSREIAPYVAPEERARASIGKNSDVFSVGAILLELLTGSPPPPDPLTVVKGTAAAPPPPVPPEILAVLRMTLAPPENRYKSSGDLRRELGKLLFSGPYSPSTFNLAYFLHDLFRGEIEAESRSRARESGSGDSGAATAGDSVSSPLPSPSAQTDRMPGPVPAPPRIASPDLTIAAPSRRGAGTLVAVLVGAAIVGGAIYGLLRKAPTTGVPSPLLPAPAVRATPTLPPESAATPAGPTTGLSEAEFRDEVARRLALEVLKLEAARPQPSPPLAATPEPPVASSPVEPTAMAPPTPAPTGVPAEMERPAPTPPPAPTRMAVREGALVAVEEADSPPKIARIVKPRYPPLALQARIGGIVVLRVLVSEKGLPVEIEVLRQARGGLTESAVGAVRQWTFQPAMKDGVAVRTWIAVPIPFEP